MNANANVDSHASAVVAGARSRRPLVLHTLIPSAPVLMPSLPPSAAAPPAGSARPLPHPGAGAYVIDGAFDERFLNRLARLHARLPVAAPTKENGADCSRRSYFCDSLGWVQRVRVLAHSFEC